MQDFPEGDGGQLFADNVFKDAVEALEGRFAFCIEEGRPKFSCQLIPQNSPPNMQILIDYLRSDLPLSPDLRNWLADMLDANVDSQLNLAIKRVSGRPRAAATRYYDRVCEVEDLIENGMARKQAIGIVSGKNNLPPDTLKKAMKSMEDARTAHAEANAKTQNESKR